MCVCVWCECVCGCVHVVRESAWWYVCGECDVRMWRICMWMCTCACVDVYMCRYHLWEQLIDKYMYAHVHTCSM